VNILRTSSVAVLAALLGSGIARDASAGPWVDDQAGHGFVQLGYSRYSADDYFTGPGEPSPADSRKTLPQGYKQPITIPVGGAFGGSHVSDYASQSMVFYGEVSLSHRFALVATMPLVTYVTQDVEFTPPAKLSQLNVGDLNVGLKYQIPHIKALKGFDFGPQIYFTAPTGDVHGRAAYPPALMTDPLPMPTGNGVADMEMRGSAGYSFYPIPIFITADVGYRHRLDSVSCKDQTGTKLSVSYSDDLPWAVQLGGSYSPKKKYFDHLTIIANLNGLHSFENGDVPGSNGAPTRGPLYAQPCGQANNASFFSVGGTIMIFPIKWFGVTYNIGHTINGVNTGYGFTNMVGFASQF
jgi:hypothetical protein